ncbi:MAG: ABC transporter substrate-binding protein [Alphaproteobacteria bacterium]
MRKLLTSVAALALLASVQPQAQAQVTEEFRLGLLVILSGPLAVIGNEHKRGAEIALEHLGGKIAGRPTKLLEGDSKANPDVAVQQASKLIDKDKIHMVTGLDVSNVLMATVGPFTKAGIFVIGANAGPSPLAGKGCNPDFFGVGFQNDTWSGSMGTYMTNAGIKSAYFLGMDYQAGWDHVGAAEKNFKGKVLGKVFTPLAQLDFAAEIAKVREAKPEALFIFYVGGAGINFVKQFAQSGLNKTIKLMGPSAIADPLLFDAQGDAALGITVNGPWNPQMDNPESKKFVATYVAQNKREPTAYAAQQYDAIMLIDSAMKTVGGDHTKRDALRAAFLKADFKSVRGKFKFNANHFPTQDFWVQRVEKNAQGKLYHKLIGIAAADVTDPYLPECKMPK